MPASLEESLDALERDQEFLLKGDVFTEDLLEMWIDHKRENDVQASRLRPTPFEYYLYYDV
jgi:glutamine synthetase